MNTKFKFVILIYNVTISADLMNMRITFRDFATMAIKQVPLNSVATVDYTNTSGGVKRKNLKRTIQIQSNVIDPSLTGPVNQRTFRKN